MSTLTEPPELGQHNQSIIQYVFVYHLLLIMKQMGVKQLPSKRKITPCLNAVSLFPFSFD